jgi:four helix bundle protein
VGYAVSANVGHRFFEGKTDLARIRLKTSEAARRDFKYRDRIFEAAASTEANITEGFHRYGRREFVRFLGISRGSLAEVEGWVRDAVARGYFTAEAAAPVAPAGPVQSPSCI